MFKMVTLLKKKLIFVAGTPSIVKFYKHDSSDEDDDDDHHSRIERPLRKFSIVSQSVFGIEQVASMPRTNSMSSQVSKMITNSNTNANQGLRRHLSAPVPFTKTETSVPSNQPKQRRFFESGSTDSINLGSSMKIFEESNGEHTQRMPMRRAQIRSISESYGAYDASDEEYREPPAAPRPIVSILKKTSLASPHDIRPNLARLTSLSKTHQEKTFMVHVRQFGKQTVKLFDFGLLRDPIYVNMMLGMAIAIFAEINFSVLTPFILTDMNFSMTEIAAFMSSLAISDIVFRFISPFIGDLLHQPPRLMYMYSLVVLMIGRAALVCMTSFIGIIICGVCLGIGKGVRTVNLNLVIPNYIPLERLASASGIQMLCNGLLILFLGPCLGKCDSQDLETNCYFYSFSLPLRVDPRFKWKLYKHSYIHEYVYICSPNDVDC
jgi:hypothetical protein